MNVTVLSLRSRISWSVRRLTYSQPQKENIRFPLGVPAFPISPPKNVKQRPLPSYGDVRPKRLRNFGIFLGVCGMWFVAGSMALNYERFSSPVTASTLHAVRKSPQVAMLLGEDIQHRSKHPNYKGWYRYDGWFRQPWVKGWINLSKGSIDVSYNVKGSRKYRLMTRLTISGGGSCTLREQENEQICEMGGDGVVSYFICDRRHSVVVRSGR
jgi:hypothetical protein